MLNFQAFPGSSGSKTTWHNISRPFIAKALRIVVKGWYQYPCMRIGIFYKGKSFSFILHSSFNKIPQPLLLRSCNIHMCEMDLGEKAATLYFVVTISFDMCIFKFSNGDNNRRKICSFPFNKQQT